MSEFCKVTNHIKKVERELAAEDRRRRGLAGRLIARKVKAKISDVYFKGMHSQPGEPPGSVTGNLLKGLAIQDGTPNTMVGFKHPAYHARMLEFGTSKMAARPMLFPTFAEEAQAVRQILSGDWLA